MTKGQLINDGANWTLDHNQIKMYPDQPRVHSREQIGSKANGQWLPTPLSVGDEALP